MGLPIVSGAGATLLTVDPVSEAARVTLYGPNGSVLSMADTGVFVPGVSAGVPTSGHDGPVARVHRVSSTGAMRTGEQALLFSDSIEGAAVNTNKWLSTVTTMTITQAVATGVLFNAANSALTTVGAMLQSRSRFPAISRNGLIYRSRVLTTQHFDNNLIELGFGTPATATAAAIGNGACWRKDGTGQWVPVLSFSNAETLGTPISNATFRASVAVSEYAEFEVFLEDTRATFRILTSTGAIVSEQYIPFEPTTGTFGVTGLTVMERIYNAAATTTAVQMRRAQMAVWYSDFVGPTEEQQAVWNNEGSLTSPTAFTQLANCVANTAPVAVTPTAIASAYATLGGQFAINPITGGEAELGLFGFQVPGSKGFTIKRVSIDVVNTGAAIAGTPTLLQWELGFNATTNSPTTGGAFRKTIGMHSFAIGAGIGVSGGPAVVWSGREKVQAGLFFLVMVKAILSTATASQVLRGVCTVEGFFE